MNYMKQIAGMFGVKIGEKFDIKSGETIIQECYIDTLGLHEEATYGGMPKLLLKVLKGDAEIVKRPWKPRRGDKYWLIGCKGDIFYHTMTEYTSDLATVCMGNCFRSKEEAEAHKDEIMAKFREVMGE